MNDGPQEAPQKDALRTDAPLADAWQRLAEAYGIQRAYDDIWGHENPLPDEARRKFLTAMGVACGDGKETVAADALAVRALAAKAAAEAGATLPPVRVLTEGEPTYIPIRPPAGVQALRWRVVEESGAVHEGLLSLDELTPAAPESSSKADSNSGQEATQPRQQYTWTPAIALPTGYHRLTLDAAGEPSAEMFLIVTPARCFEPARRYWGLAAQLYGLRAADDWGCGDFGSLRRLISFAAPLGADVIGLNPLHASFLHNPAHSSPYSPSNRLLPNVLYIRPQDVPEFNGCATVLERFHASDFQERLRAARATELVDWPEVAALKLAVLEPLYRDFRDHHLAHDDHRARAFRAFQQDGGESLRSQALFDALQAHFHGQDPGIWGWPVWPEEFRDCGSAAVAAFAEAHLERVEFYEYLYWLADEQLAGAAEYARDGGIELGLYRDLALGADSGGGETWANRDLYARGVSLGAPPDELALQGQNWGLPPIVPGRLRDAAYRPFVELVRRNMRHTGALRIDHVMSLMRLFWVPEGMPTAQGGYVLYPFEDLVGIVALESQRNHCVVIGEDLGTVPPEVRETMGRRGVLSYRLLYFEKYYDGDQSFLAPAEYPEQALVMPSTHDLPTLAGFWEGSDLRLRHDLGLFPSAELEARQRETRAQDRPALVAALRAQGLLPEDAQADGLPPAVLARAVYEYLGRAPSRLLLVQLEDLSGQIDQVNLPGTTDQHPNWVRKLSLSLDELEQLPLLRELAAALTAERRGQG